MLVPALAGIARLRTIAGGALWGALFGAAAVTTGGIWLVPMMVSEFGLSWPAAGGAMLGLAVGFGWPFAAFGALGVAAKRAPWPGWLGGALAFQTAEWLRGVGPEPFTWLRLGDALHAHPWWAQPASLGGVPLLTLALVVLNGLIFEALTGRGRPRRRTVAQALLVLVAWMAISGWRWQATASTPTQALRVALVQVATPQHERFREETRERNLDRQLALTRRATAEGAQLVVWSETALDFLPGEGRRVEERILQTLGGEPGRALLAGSLVPVATRFGNAVVLYESGRGVRGSYLKRHLVPFVERLPSWMDSFPEWRRRLGRLATPQSYVAGRSRAPLQALGIPIGVLICYESIFENLAREDVVAGAEILVNVSNDAYFPLSGAEQHLAIATMRAIELGRPLVRVSNRGIGAVIDARGTVLARIPRDERGLRVVTIHPQSRTTPYAAGGHHLDEALVALALLGAGLGRGRATTPGFAA